MPDEAECGVAAELTAQQQRRRAKVSSTARGSKAVASIECRNCNGAPPQQQEQPLSFDRWFARRERATDILLLLAELLLINWFYSVRLLAATSCEGKGGMSCSSVRGSSFPCGASYPHQLLFTLRSGAVLDLRLRLRFWDYGNLAHISGQMLAALLALLVPSVYERTRHVLFAATNAGVLLGIRLSLARAPDALLPVIAVGYMSSKRSRMTTVYFGWKAVTVFRVPASQQLVIGPVLWLLAVSVLPTVDRRLPPPPHDSPWIIHTALMFVVIAVLPYMLVRARDRAFLQPRYRDYLRSCAAASPSGETGSGGTGTSGGGAGASSSRDGGHGGSKQHLDRAATGPAVASAPPSPQSAAAITTTTVAAAARPRVRRRTFDVSQVFNASPTSSSIVSELDPSYQSVVYRPMGRGGGGVSRTMVVSAKLTIRHDDPTQPGCPTFAQAAAKTTDAAATALRSHNAGIRTRVHTLGVAGGSSGSRSNAPVFVPPPLRCLSRVCVKGCVQLLFVVHQLAEQQQEARPMGDHIPVRHLSLSAASTAGDDDTTAAGSALQQLLSFSGNGFSGDGSCGDDGYERDVCQAAGGGGVGIVEVSNAFAFAWPPALPLEATPEVAAEERRGEGKEEEAKEEELEAAAVVVVVAAAALRGLRSVRCVVAGPSGEQPQSQQAELYLDVEGTVELLRPQQESGSGLAAVRLAISPTALRTTGMLLLHLLPPHTASAPVSPYTAAASASGAPSAAPLAMLPLLVLPAAAAQEVRELYGDVLGNAAVGRLEQLLLRPEAATEPAGPAAYDGADRSDPIAATEEGGSSLAAATAALQDSGLTALVLDMGALLQLPPYGRGDEPEHEQGYDEMGAGGDNLWAFADLIRFLSARRMAGCLREGLRAMRRAGVQLTCERGPPGGAAACGGTEGNGGGEDAEVEAAVRRLLAPAAGDGASGAAAATDALAMPSAQFDAQPIGVRSWQPILLRLLGFRSSQDAVPSAGNTTLTSSSDDAGGSGNFSSRRDDSGDASTKQKAKISSGDVDPAAASADSDGGDGMVGPQPPPRRSRLALVLWWLRALLCGFPQRPHEAAYQAYKAASCRSLDSMALVLYIGIRIATTLHTYSNGTLASAAASPGANAAPAASVSGTSGGGADTEQAATRLTAWLTFPKGSCGGVTAMHLQLVAQWLYLAAGLAAVGVALCTRMHARRRNSFLLLRCVMDSVVLMLVLLPVPWLLGPPDAWMQCDRQVGIHWIVFGLWEPMILQVSPYLQALHTLVNLLPRTLLGFHVYYCAWRPALLFGFGQSACSLVISAATDFSTRCQFVRQQNRGRRPPHTTVRQYA